MIGDDKKTKDVISFKEFSERRKKKAADGSNRKVILVTELSEEEFQAIMDAEVPDEITYQDDE